MSSPHRSIAGGEAHAIREECVFTLAAGFVTRHAGTPARGQLLSAAIATWREALLMRQHEPASIHLAPLVYAGLWGDEAVAYPLAATTMLLSAGLDMLAPLPLFPAGPVAWAVSTLSLALPNQIVASLDAPASVRASLHKTLADRIPCLLAYEEPVVIAHRDGEAAALAAELGATLAGAAPRVVGACRDLGRALGTGHWLAAEVQDLGRSRDSNPAELPHRISTLEFYRQRAVRALAASGLLEPARQQLYTMIAAMAIDNTLAR